MLLWTEWWCCIMPELLRTQLKILTWIFWHRLLWYLFMSFYFHSPGEKEVCRVQCFEILCVSWQGKNQRLLTTSTCGNVPTALASKPTSAGNTSPLPTCVLLPLQTTLPHFCLNSLLSCLLLLSPSLPLTNQSHVCLHFTTLCLLILFKLFTADIWIFLWRFEKRNIPALLSSGRHLNHSLHCSRSQRICFFALLFAALSTYHASLHPWIENW